MKTVRKIVNETIEDFLKSQHAFYIIVVLSARELEEVGLINEGKWTSSEEKGYSLRIDQKRLPHDMKHVHIASDKHITAKNKQVSWNENGSRHDKKTFNDNFIGIETAKRIARRALGISDDIRLECFSNSNLATLILESTGETTENQDLYIFCNQEKKFFNSIL